MTYEEKIHGLSAGQLALLLQKSKKTNLHSVESAPDRAGRFFPLSFAQKSLWLQSHFEQDHPTYHIPLAQIITSQEPFNRRLLEIAIHGIIRDNEILRTTFHVHEGVPVQQVHASLSIRVQYDDLTNRFDQAIELATLQAQKPFDLEKGPLLRFSVIQIGWCKYIFLTVMHHLISDGWSNQLFFSALAAGLFSVKQQGLKPMQYLDAVEWEQKQFTPKYIELSLPFWKTLLSGELPRTKFPSQLVEGKKISTQGAQKTFLLADTLSQQIKQFSKTNRTTLFVTLLTTFQVLLFRYTAEDDLLIGLPYANRPLAQFHNTFGLFINLLPLRSRIVKNNTFYTHLEQIDRLTKELFNKADMPFNLLVETLGLQSSGMDPIFHVLFVHQNFPRILQRPEVQVSSLAIDTGYTPYPLTFIVEEFNDDVIIKIKYQEQFYEPWFIDQIFNHYTNILRAVISDPYQQITQISLLSQQEKTSFLGKARHPRWHYRKPLLFPHAFEAQVIRTPHAIALECLDNSLSYSKVNQQANQLAHAIRKYNLPPQARIALLLDRNVHLVIALLAVLKSGACFVPIESTFPIERIRHMLQESGALLLLTETKVASQISALDIPYVLVDTREEHQMVDNLEVTISPSDLAYMIFTSGSTGQPKAVAIEHQQLAYYIESIAEETHHLDLQSFGFTSTIAADMGYTNLFLPLSQGSSAIVMPKEISDDPSLLSAQLERRSVDCLKFVPSQLTFLLQTGSPTAILPKKLLILAGEAIPYSLIQELMGRKLHMEIIMSYGPTETTVGAMTHQNIDRRPWTKYPPLGHPNLHSAIYLLDASMQFVPKGVCGEIYIGGECLARGYWNQPALTVEKFLPDPFSKQLGARLYKTGDQARYSKEGEIEFLGRKDRQIKVRGHRVELGEIEAALIRLVPKVEQAAVVATSEGLSAWLVCPEAPSEKSIKNTLRPYLPAHMIPTHITILQQFPLTPSGKIDLIALQRLGGAKQSEAKRAPRDPIELSLTDIWTKVFNTAQIGIDEHFFDLGGHSFLALELILKIEKIFGIKMPLATLFQHSTIEQLAKIIREKAASFYQTPLVTLRQASDDPPFFFIHPAGGQVLCYHGLVKALKQNVPVYGLQSPFMADNYPETCDTIEKNALKYLEYIPEEKIPLFGGWSLGGLIAFEMARVFFQKTKKHPFVVIIDQPIPQLALQKEEPYLLRFLKQIEGFNETSLQIPYELFAGQSFSKQADWIYNKLLEKQLLPSDVKLEHFIRFLEVQKMQSTASGNYKPDRYDGPVLLIRADQSHWNQPVLGWEMVASNLTTQWASGTHMSIMKGHSIHQIAERVESWVFH